MDNDVTWNSKEQKRLLVLNEVIAGRLTGKGGGRRNRRGERISVRNKVERQSNGEGTTNAIIWRLVRIAAERQGLGLGAGGPDGSHGPRPSKTAAPFRKRPSKTLDSVVSHRSVHRSLEAGSKFVAVDDHAFFAVGAELAGDHLDRLADLDVVGVDVG